MLGKRVISFRLALFCALLFSRLMAQTDLRIAVLDFQNLTGRDDMIYLEKAIPQVMMTDLALCPKISVIERARLQEILDEMQLSLSGIIDENKAAKVGEMAGANAILLGSLIVGGSTYRIDARLVDVASGKIILADMKDWLSEDEIIRGTDELAQQIIRNLTGELVPINPEITIESPIYFKDRTLSVETALDQPFWLNGSDLPLYLQVDIYSKEVPRRGRIPLNIALVLDQSGSMASEDKLGQVKTAAKFVVNNLDDNDIISLITYETNVQTVIPAQKITNKRKIISTINDITSGGSTNLSGGMLQGYAEVARNLKTGQVNRVLLLSDGLANTGITRSDKLREICGEKNANGLTISTFGVGADFDEDMLQGLADIGKGNYYFIDSPEQIPVIFSREMTGLLAMAAQNVRIDLETAPGITVENVIGFTFNSEERRSAVTLGDVFSNDHYTITFQLRVTGRIDDTQQAANLTLSYDDVVNKGDRVTTSVPIQIQITNDENVREQYRNPYVSGRIAFVQSSKEIQSVMADAGTENIAETRAELKRQLQNVTTSAGKYKSNDLKKQILAIAKYDQELTVAEKLSNLPGSVKGETQTSGESIGIMQKATKYDTYQAQRGKNEPKKFEFPKDTQEEQKIIKPTPANKQISEPERKPIEKPVVKPDKPKIQEVKKADDSEGKKVEEKPKDTPKVTPSPAKPAEIKETKPAVTDTKTTETTKTEPDSETKDKKAKVVE
ncbi:MAG: VWA domain-containing protein [Candidatus Neomarinimicrobiota bacterium]